MIGLLLTLVIIGVILYLVETYIPMSPPIKLLIRIVVVLFVVLWLASLFGLTDIAVPRIR
jgi:hypothetical protein